ncbi:MAG: AAA family ATPase, partial [Anaerolineales bacterium]
MSITIKSIQVKRMGPLAQFQMELGKLNLIYGLNESGKTFLVEFLLRSLFRPSKRWEIRETNAQGSVDVTGLENGTVRFSPESSRKLEDYWQEAEAGLPADLARLLVVKGGELALTSRIRGGISREVLKSVLTSQELLDELWDSIQPTIRNAVIDEGQIHGKNMGKLKDRNQILEEISSLTRLFEQIEKSYSRGPARQLEIQLESIQGLIEREEHAKRYLAYQLSKEIHNLKTQISALPEEALIQQRDRIRDFRKAKRDLKSLEERHQGHIQESKGYRWLGAAIETWEEKGLDGKTRPPKAIG